jgi:Cdc6-like AAA superfamily ATPase
LFDIFRGRSRKKSAKSGAIRGPSSTVPPAARPQAAKARDRGDADFPHFRATASDQLDPALSDRLTALRLKLRNAYTPSQPVSDRRLFAGRTEVLSALIRSVEDRRLHTIIYGDRGIGKTSILHVLAQAAREARYLVVYVSIGANSDFDEVFRTVAGKFPLLYHADYGPTSREAERGDALADILPPGRISVRAASEFCTKLVGTRTLVLLDEFDRSESPEFKRNVAEFLKNLSDQQARVQLVIAGVAANLTEMLTEIPSIRRNIFAVEIPRMTSDEVRQLVKKGEAASGLSFDAAALELIISVANGVPYLASLLSQYVGLAALNDGRLKVVSSDVQVAINDVLVELQAQLSPRTLAQLANLARSGGEVILGRLAGYAKISNGEFDVSAVDLVYPTAEAAALCRSMLMELAVDGGLLVARDDESGRSYRFVDPNVPQYLWLVAEQQRYLNSPVASGLTAARAGGFGAQDDVAQASNA